MFNRTQSSRSLLRRSIWALVAFGALLSLMLTLAPVAASATSVDATVPVGNGPSGIVVSPDGQPNSIAISPDGRQIGTTSWVDSTISKISTITDQVVASSSRLRRGRERLSPESGP